MPSPNLSEIVTTTLYKRNKELADNVSNGNALLARMNQKGNVRSADGGRQIVEELEYAENSTFMYYSGYEALNINPSDVFSAAVYDWKQAAVNVSASGLEVEIQNSGREAVINLLEKRISNAMKTMRNNLSTGIYSDGTGTAGKQIGGLQLIVADAGTGTVGGIDSSTFTFWQNQTSGDVSFAGASPDPSNTTDQGTLKAEMHELWLETTRGPDKTDFIVGDAAMFNTYWSSLTEIQRITTADEGVGGFRSIKFVDADVFYDGDSGIPANHMYFLNTDYIYLRPHSRRNLVPLEKKASLNQDAMVVPVVWAGNMTCSNRDLQGVIYT
jgi:hypothetical protein